MWIRTGVAALAALVGTQLAFGDEIPRASKPDLAVAAVMARTPEGSKYTLGTYAAIGEMLSKLVGMPYKSVGWGAEPNGEGWRVVYVYIGTSGREGRATWLVDANWTITPESDSAKEIERKAAKFSQDDFRKLLDDAMQGAK